MWNFELQENSRLSAIPTWKRSQVQRHSESGSRLQVKELCFKIQDNPLAALLRVKQTFCQEPFSHSSLNPPLFNYIQNMFFARDVEVQERYIQSGRNSLQIYEWQNVRTILKFKIKNYLTFLSGQPLKHPLRRWNRNFLCMMCCRFKMHTWGVINYIESLFIIPVLLVLLFLV